MRGHSGGFDLDIFINSHADGLECPEHAVERLFLLLGEQFDVLDAGELVVERVRHLYSLQIHGENRFLPFRGDSDLFGDILGLERGLGGEKHQYLGVADGLDDLLASKGGALNVALVQPVGDTGLAEAFHERQDAVAIGPGIADEDLGAHTWLFGAGIMQNEVMESKERIRYGRIGVGCA